MKDEIKEMNLSEMLFNRDERLLDCITNLQEELEEQKRIEQASLDTINNLQEENEHLDKVNCHLRKKINNDIYKQRNEKAIEFNQIVLNSDYVYSQNEIAQNNLIILQGSDKDVKN